MLAPLTLDVFILTNKRLELLQACYNSVRKALPLGANILVLVNDSDEWTESWLSSLNDPSLYWSVIPAEARGAARNRAFSLSRADIVYFLDDDVVTPPHLFQDCLAQFEEDPALFLIGGPNLTPPNASFAEMVFGAVLTTWFAAPFIRMRYGGVSTRQKKATERDLMLCNLAVRRSMKPKGLFFSTSLCSNEENLFIYRCSRFGLRAKYSSEQYVYHRRRKDLVSFARQIASYGRGRAEQTWLCPRSTHPAFWVPAISLVGGIALSLDDQGRPLVQALLMLYAILALLSAALSFRVRRLGLHGILSVALLTPLVHLSYAAGFLSMPFSTLPRRGSAPTVQTVPS